ncbi:MAG: glycosyltransferase family 2 protein [Deltaproteobacteria bacterium]|nr:glycosyltransferase family 2 protein [Deltaproteobacteria bacterium]
MKKITISIIIPTFNYVKFIKRAIDSVLNQNLLPLELIIIDDGSTDNTEPLVSQYINQELPIPLVYYKKENQGVAAARNDGAGYARGDYILFLDADDELLPDALKNLTEPFQRHPELGLVLGQGIYVNKDGEPIIKKNQFLYSEPVTNFKAYLDKNIFIANISCLLIKRAIFKKIDFPAHLRVSEDRCVFAQLLALCRGASIGKPVVRLYYHDDSLSNSSHEFTVNHGLEVVDAIFNPQILPKRFLKYKDSYYTYRCLSLFRRCYKLGYYRPADNYYRLALKNNIMALFKYSHLGKYIRMKLKSLFLKGKGDPNGRNNPLFP